MMDRKQLEQVIASLESQRTELGDSIVDLAASCQAPSGASQCGKNVICGYDYSLDS